jgi:hypothetical protein
MKILPDYIHYDKELFYELLLVSKLVYIFLNSFTHFPYFSPLASLRIWNGKPISFCNSRLAKGENGQKILVSQFRNQHASRC